MRIRTKLLALIAVPVLAIGFAAAIGFTSQSRAIERAEASTETVTRTNSVYGAVIAVGAERLDAAGAEMDTPRGELRLASDEAVRSLADVGFVDLAEQIEGELSTARGAAGDAAVGQYTEINADLLAIPEGAADQFPDAGSRDEAITNRLAVESLEARELAWISYLSSSEPTIETASGLAAEFANSTTSVTRTQEFADDPAIDGVLQSDAAVQLSNLETIALDDLNEEDLSVSSEEALQSLADFRAGWSTVVEDGTADIQDNVDSQLVGENNLRSLFTLLAVIGVVVGLGLIFVIYRSITQPLESLLDRASQVANEDLPSLVTTLRDTENDGELPTAEVIPVTSDDEIGELVSAFNDVQVTAYDLATEQALGRRATGEMFVNLGRRNQRLLERILAKLSELQREERDPDALESLFELDNIVTRMRRNAESLLVMAGATTPRQWRQSVNVDDTVRAAVGEVEGYQRINIEDLDAVDFRGNAVADVSHLLAELLENAINFSDGNSEVKVTGQSQSDTYVLNISDNGIGMTAEEFDTNNARIQDPPPLDQIPTKFLGLYVVGRLADRHGIDVRLSDAPKSGVLARIEIPSSLIDASENGDESMPSTVAADEAELLESVEEADSAVEAIDDDTAVVADLPGDEVDAELDEEVDEEADVELDEDEASSVNNKKAAAGVVGAKVAADDLEPAADAGRPKLPTRPGKKTKRRKEDESESGATPGLPTRQKGKALKKSAAPKGGDRRKGSSSNKADNDSPDEAVAGAPQGASGFSAMMSALSTGVNKGIEDVAGEEEADQENLQES